MKYVLLCLTHVVFIHARSASRDKREAADNEEDEDDERKANTHDTQGASAAFVLVDEDTMQYKYNEKDEDCFPCKAVCAAWRRAASFEYSDMK